MFSLKTECIHSRLYIHTSSVIIHVYAYILHVSYFMYYGHSTTVFREVVGMVMLVKVDMAHTRHTGVKR